MSASPAVRGLRAGVFAAVCVLLAAAGHGLSMGDMPPLWADGAGFLGVFAAGWLLGGRERTLPGIGAAMLATQALLHLAFDAAQAHAAAAGPGVPGTVMRAAMAGMPGMAGAPGGAALAQAAAGHPHTLPPHAAAAHVLAALVASWWLRRGEAALWSLLRRAVACVPGLVAWWRPAPPLPRSTPAAAHGAAPALPPRQLLLRHAVSRRGPPARIPYPA
ncbi:hypothetical protein [Streptomyces tropicalis]|uniref:Integral membrane protein n=1 Tax=Streptomyces tropicalis TaxID=3034234 RepID=A0ABT6AC71_9ACTN|nr:hypothetical protein [Streptomyces tropicalis]MDF3302058.1 hypothetical protein [Streptomyces tropicalis]